jgi:nitrate/nitrite-specific signal transduction histidine kinase
LSRAATRLASGDFDVYVPSSRQDEFGHLAQVFNDMAARLGEIYAGMNQQIRELRIVLDETTQKEKFAEIVDTDYFRQLTTEGAKLRNIMNSK